MPNFETLQKCVEKAGIPDGVSHRLFGTFLGGARSLHPATMNAVNRHKGDWYLFQFFDKFGLTAENLFDDFFGQYKEAIVNSVNGFIPLDISELDRILYRIFRNNFEEDYLACRKQLKESLQSAFEDRFREETWVQAEGEYGMGRGYKDRVMAIYDVELQRFASEVNIRDAYNAKWKTFLQENSLS